MQTVLSGSNYIRGKRGMMLIAEALQQLQIEAFTATLNLPSGINEALKEFKNFVDCEDDHRTWRNFQDRFEPYLTSFKEFINQFLLLGDHYHSSLHSTGPTTEDGHHCTLRLPVSRKQIS